MNSLRAFLKLLLWILLLPPLIYMVAVLIGAVITINSQEKTSEPFTEIYLVSNGIHTDIVLPAKSEVIDWTEVVEPQHSYSHPKNPDFVSFGWGDLEFYRNVPQWSDLKLKTAFRVLFQKTPSAVHARFLTSMPEGEEVKIIEVNKHQYKKLAKYIKDSFQYNDIGETVLIPNLHYTVDDAFYRGKGSLHLFNTCNTWVNTGLKTAGLKACLWTPFVKGIFLKYPENDHRVTPTAAAFNHIK